MVAEHTGRLYGMPVTAGDIYTIAGHRFGRTGNGVPAVRAKLVNPSSVAVNARAASAGRRARRRSPVTVLQAK